MFAKRTSIIPKSVRNKLIIKALSLKAMVLVIKFGWIANTSKPNTNKSSKQSFSIYFKYYCKMVNLIVNTLGWSRGMLSVNGKSHVIRHVLTLQIFGAPKKLRFWQNREEMFNRHNSTNWVELHKGYMQGSRDEVTCRGHGVRSRAGGMQVVRSDLHFTNGWSYNSGDLNVGVSW